MTDLPSSECWLKALTNRRHLWKRLVLSCTRCLNKRVYDINHNWVTQRLCLHHWWGYIWSILLQHSWEDKLTRVGPQEASPPQQNYIQANPHAHTRRLTLTHTRLYNLKQHTCNPFMAVDQQQQHPVVLNPHGLLIGVFRFCLSSPPRSHPSHFSCLPTLPFSSPASYPKSSHTGMWLVGKFHPKKIRTLTERHIQTCLLTYYDAQLKEDCEMQLVGLLLI